MNTFKPASRPHQSNARRFFLSTACLTVLLLVSGPQIFAAQNKPQANAASPRLGTTAAANQNAAAALPATENTLYQFNIANGGGYHPSGELMQASDGNFYGVTADGGSSSQGTLYQLTPAGKLTVLYSFTGGNDGGGAYGAPIEASDGNLYGITNSYGADGSVVTGGTIYQYNLTTGVLTTVYTFQNGGVAGFADMVDDGAGTLYGTANFDDASGNNLGSVWSFNYRTNTFTTLHTFTGPDGMNPVGGLVLAADGNLYGTAEQGGPYVSGSPLGAGYGTAFVMATDGSGFQVFHNFDNGGQGVEDGFWPTGSLVQAADGNLYGFTFLGGNTGNGTGVFYRIVPKGAASTLQSIYEFQAGDGNNPLHGRPFLGGDGNFYLTGSEGGAHGQGQVMQLSTTGAKADVYDFGTNPGDGSVDEVENQPFESTDGNLYGPTGAGGAPPQGTLYQVLTSLPPVIALTPSAGNVNTGDSVTLSWSTNNAFSKSAQACSAYSSDNSWTGAVAATGSATVKPVLANGIVTYSITCGGSESAVSSIVVGYIQPEITTTALAPGVVRTPYAQTLTLLGAMPPYTWSIASGNLPPGLSLNSATGAISGTPQTSGTFDFTVEVMDSASPQGVGTASLGITIMPAPPVPPTVSLTASPSSLILGQSTTLTATVAGLPGVPTPTGTVQFQSNGAPLGAPVTLSATGTAAMPGLSLSATGSYGISAAYSGDMNYTTGNVATTTLSVTAPVVAAIAATPGTVTISSPGSSATATIKVFNFPDSSVSFACAGLPQGASCSFGALSASGTSALQITTTAGSASALNLPPGGNSSRIAYAFMFPGMLAIAALFSTRKRYPQWRTMLILLALLSTGAALTGCGGGGSPKNTAPSPAPSTATPSGTSTVMVTATDGNQSANATLTLIVQ